MSSDPGLLTSLRNPRVQRARRLLRRVHRRQENAFLLEGSRAVADALERRAAIEELFVTEELATDPSVVRARERGISVHTVGTGIVKAISGSVTPQGIVAIAHSPLQGLDQIRLSSGLVLVLVAVSDPGNAGTLVRTAAAARADGAILTSGSADVLNPKTVRAAAAALFEVPLVADVAVGDATAHLRSLGYQIVGTDTAASTTIYDVDLGLPTAIVVGSEAHGLSSEQLGSLDVTASIPMPGPVESLNVAMAGSIVVFECLRQRASYPRSISREETRE